MVAPEGDERWAMHHNYWTRDKCTLQINGSLFSLFHPFSLNIVCSVLLLLATISFMECLNPSKGTLHTSIRTNGTFLLLIPILH